MGEEIKSLKDLDRVIPFRKALLASLGLEEQFPGVKKSVQYAGSGCFLETEVEDTDEAQYWLGYYQGLGYKACCLHENGKHQVYVSREKR